jgi:hypothetical protein
MVAPEYNPCPVTSLAIASLLLLLHPHSAPTLWVDAKIAQDEVEMLICIRGDHAEPWIYEALPADELMDLITAEESKLACAAVQKYFSKNNPVYINEKRVMPIARAVETPEDAEGNKLIDYLAFRISYPCEDWPKTVRFEWQDFEGASFQNEPLVPGTLRIGPQVELMAFAEDDPTFTWALPASGLPTRRGVESVPAPPAGTVPWIAHGILAFTFLVGSFGLLRVRAGASAWLIVVSLVSTGAMALPWKVSEEPVIAEPQARVVFETLLGNVYSAFDAITEEEEYDLLALSVEDSLLDELYLDVRKGLIIRTQGGAVAQVGNIERRSSEIEFTGAREFRAKWRWRVYAHITHWAHTHSRINEYLAEFKVRATDDGWRISEYEVLDLARIPVPEEER